MHETKTWRAVERATGRYFDRNFRRDRGFVPPPRLAGSVAKRSAFNHFWDRLLMCTPVSRTDGIEMEWFVPTTVRTVCVLSSH